MTLLFFVIISLTITSAAIIIVIINSVSVGKLAQGTVSYYAAESGIENALLRVLREPAYAGETLTIDSVTVVITVTGANPKLITAVAQNGKFKRTVQAQMNYSNGYYTFTNWKEI